MSSGLAGASGLCKQQSWQLDCVNMGIQTDAGSSTAGSSDNGLLLHGSLALHQLLSK
jgi:hypothetical protein